jgi:hypothetical protein
MIEETPIRKHYFRSDEELIFKRQFVIQFLASHEAENFDRNSSVYGWKNHQERIPVEDAACLAQRAWDRWVEVIGVVKTESGG